MTVSLSSPIGRIYITGDAGAITEVTLSERRETASTPLLDEAVRQLNEYFAGERRVFSLPVRLDTLTQFQQKVLSACASIPYGETMTYGEVARLIGNPKASRAVGGALHINPCFIIIPCHRGVSSSSLGGFGFGPEVKEKLLSLEKAQEESSL